MINPFLIGQKMSQITTILEHCEKQRARKGRPRSSEEVEADQQRIKVVKSEKKQ